MTLDEIAARMSALFFYEATEEYRGERESLSRAYNAALAASREPLPPLHDDPEIADLGR